MKISVQRGLFFVNLSKRTHNRPTARTIRYTIVKFETQKSLLDNTRTRRPHPARSEDNIAAVAGSVRDDCDESIRRSSQQLGVSYATTLRILCKDLGLKAYRIQLVLDLRPTDLLNRHRLSVCAVEMFEEDSLFSTKMFIQ